ncbi:helix-turn-helix domain-containing protein [Streptomyces virginiae]|uniref:helix-turn-helix domain-containing protein n=1 Tax=Streptomyces virginiae TaxID=1961 RepID=UPI003679E839
MTSNTITNTRRILTGGQWFLITGLVFYSLMTTTPLVAEHSKWAWSGAALGLIVDAAFIMALSAESTLARHSVTKLGAWPVAFRWFTGLSSVFLNVWASVSAQDWVGVAIHMIAPALVMLLAEVGPVYMAALAAAENVEPTEPQEARQVAIEDVAEAFDVPVSLLAPEEPQSAPEDVPAPPADTPARLTNKEANALIEKGWRHKLSPDEVAKAAGRHPSTVRRRYAEFDVAMSV